VRTPDRTAGQVPDGETDATDANGSVDWHPADVLAALKKRGLSLAGLSVAHGYHPTAAGKALKKPWPALEALIADAIGIPAAQLWPSRYAPGGRSRSRPEA
jgi:Ner family transcriptional regulator